MGGRPSKSGGKGAGRGAGGGGEKLDAIVPNFLSSGPGDRILGAIKKTVKNFTDKRYNEIAVLRSDNIMLDNKINFQRDTRMRASQALQRVSDRLARAQERGRDTTKLEAEANKIERRYKAANDKIEQFRRQQEANKARMISLRQQLKAEYGTDA